MAKRATGRTSPQYRALLIAPESHLPNADAETQRVINALRPECLLGEVNTHDVLDCLQRNEFEIVWFLGHSNSEGLKLSDGILSPAHLTQMLRACAPQLVVLNSCSSLHTAIQVHDDLQCATICTVLDVPDLDAFVTGAALASALAQGLDIATAYQTSRPASNRQYVLLNGSVRLNGSNELDDMHRLILPILRTTSDIQQELAGTAREITALRSDVAGMKTEMAAVRSEQERVRSEVAASGTRYQPRSDRLRALSWAGGFVLFVAAYTILEFRTAIGAPPLLALSFAGFVALVSFALFVWGIGLRWER
jgi:hypothetical protein